jgi:3-deoxy-D-manno-octulosonic-acid transferase
MLAARLPVNEALSKRLSKKIGERKVWMAVSTHVPEDEMIYSVHKRLKKTYPDILTILAIRHPTRTNDVLRVCGETGLTCSRYTETIKNQKKIIEDVYVLDKLGVLGDFFSVVDTVLVCGSLVPGIGGHNLLEPLQFACNVAVGEYISNFEDIYDSVSKNCKKLRNIDELYDFIDDSFKHYTRPADGLSQMDYELQWAEAIKTVLRAVF